MGRITCSIVSRVRGVQLASHRRRVCFCFKTGFTFSLAIPQHHTVHISRQVTGFTASVQSFRRIGLSFVNVGGKRALSSLLAAV